MKCDLSEVNHFKYGPDTCNEVDLYFVRCLVILGIYSSHLQPENGLNYGNFVKKWWLDVQKSQLLVRYKALIFLIMLPYVKPRIQYFSQPTALISIQKIAKRMSSGCQFKARRTWLKQSQGAFIKDVQSKSRFLDPASSICVGGPKAYTPHPTLGRPTF